jgi:predicted DNA-binding transcriptional regulator YafY
MCGAAGHEHLRNSLRLGLIARPLTATRGIFKQFATSFTGEVQDRTWIHHAVDSIDQYGHYPSYIVPSVDLSFGRLLTLIELLQVYRQLTAADISERLEVSPRTVRRYITGLQDMGIPVEADRGPAGGYRLRRGFKLPPVMLTNDEALVMVIGLLAAQRLGLSASSPAIQGALGKLHRLLPDPQREQVQAMQDFVSLGLDPVSRDHADADTILTMTSAARDGTSIRLGYRSAAGDVTDRVVDPYGVAFQNGHWYVVSWDHFRAAIRTFRLDRILSTQVTSETFQRPENFDVISEIQRAIRELMYGIRCEVVLDLTLADAQARVSPTDGTVEEVEGGTLLRFGADDLEWASSYLVRLECDFVVQQPPELRTSMRRMAARLSAAARRPRARRSTATVRGSAPGR